MDEYNFGPILRMRHDGSFSAETWRDRLRDELAQAFWPKSTYTVVNVDTETGTITLERK